MIRVSIAILFVAISTLNIYCESRSKTKQRASKSEYLQVTKVVDGDTFWADNGTSKGVKIRLIGVDAPESKKAFKKEVGYYGKEAKAYLVQLISGKSVKIICDVDSLDQYGRTLAYVYMENGTFINADLVKNGYAMVMTVPPNVKHADEFVKLQQEARENNRGLWRIGEK
jgi:micrococcal nuclease